MAVFEATARFVGAVGGWVSPLAPLPATSARAGTLKVLPSENETVIAVAPEL